MEMQRIIEMLAEMQEKSETNRKEMKSNQERMDANLKDLKEDIKYGQEEIRSIFEAIKPKIHTWIANIRDDRKERTSCQETTDAHLECEEPTPLDTQACQETIDCHEATEADMEKIEPDPEMMQSLGEHQEVPKEDARVNPVKGRKKQHTGQKLAAGRCGEPGGLTRGNCESWRNLAAACKKTPHCRGVA
jgi:hypothetical protein